jgi:hypothetical protein
LMFMLRPNAVIEAIFWLCKFAHASDCFRVRRALRCP